MLGKLETHETGKSPTSRILQSSLERYPPLPNKRFKQRIYNGLIINDLKERTDLPCSQKQKNYMYESFLKNWRPITLLDCDYKIAAKAIVSRIRKVLPNIVNNDQTGFMKNRFIGENIMLINSIINYTN